MLNKVTLIGNLGKDPEIRTLDNGNDKASFSLATSQSWKDKQSGEKKSNTQWHNIVAWKGNAKFASYLKKGNLVCVEGMIEYRKYEKDGEQKSFTEIKAIQITNLTKREDKGGSGSYFSGASHAREVKAALEDPLPF